MCACTHETQYRAWSLSDHTGLSPSAFFVGNTSVATSSRGGYPAFVDRPSAMAWGARDNVYIIYNDAGLSRLVRRTFLLHGRRPPEEAREKGRGGTLSYSPSSRRRRSWYRRISS